MRVSTCNPIEREVFLTCRVLYEREERELATMQAIPGRRTLRASRRNRPARR
jgi:hypothetical protein